MTSPIDQEITLDPQPVPPSQASTPPPQGNLGKSPGRPATRLAVGPEGVTGPPAGVPSDRPGTPPGHWRAPGRPHSGAPRDLDRARSTASCSIAPSASWYPMLDSAWLHPTLLRRLESTAHPSREPGVGRCTANGQSAVAPFAPARPGRARKEST